METNTSQLTPSLRRWIFGSSGSVPHGNRLHLKELDPNLTDWGGKQGTPEPGDPSVPQEDRT